MSILSSISAVAARGTFDVLKNGVVRGSLLSGNAIGQTLIFLGGAKVASSIVKLGCGQDPSEYMMWGVNALVKKVSGIKLFSAIEKSNEKELTQIEILGIYQSVTQENQGQVIDPNVFENALLEARAKKVKDIDEAAAKAEIHLSQKEKAVRHLKDCGSVLVDGIKLIAVGIFLGGTFGVALDLFNGIAPAPLGLYNKYFLCCTKYTMTDSPILSRMVEATSAVVANIFG